jgi:hypothetical protein
MISRKRAISRAYCDIDYEKLKPLLNMDCWIWVNSFRRDFPDVLLDENAFDFNEGRLRPKSLRNISSNGGWSSTGYHVQSERPKPNPFRDDTYYHIGFLNHDGSFDYQGIKLYKDGFFDEAGYYLKPFPTHYIEIKQPQNPVYDSEMR